MSKFKKTGKWLICENEHCSNKFYRVKHAILEHNFCSQSCAAIVNNHRYPKWPKRYCAICKKEFKNRDSEYCSTKCGYLSTSNYRNGKSKYTREQIILVIRNFYQQHKRVPAKREVLGIVGCATHKFGSWTATIAAAGLEPHRSHDHRMYRRMKTKARDGHVCDSISEVVIDNWLAKHNISHTRNAKYPTTNHQADWAIKDSTVFVEYFGLAKDSPRYDKEIKRKQNLCRKNKIKLVEIYPSDLYLTISLDVKLASFR